ncbi:MAG: deoxyguanosinetriphosphate triphosphohydrolase [Clostridia bacterium]|nr:deoxyguanosinetriphosphate triphosphohydrolase [Clostridia bacterium]
MLLREIAEEREERELAPRATRSRDTKGRLKPEQPCEVRTEFQRDRDRSIHSKSFRRLKDKTQVFVIAEGDHYRTRLTHTLEVAQIARTIARALRLNEDLTEAIALGHDLGHTPFGHAGEEALNAVCPDGFKHNEQSLRVVENLEGGNGLNLTWEVRDGILNHTGNGFPSTLEGQVVRIADRVAYINHDIDDAMRGGLITMADLPRDCLAILGAKHRDRINTMVRDLILTSWDSDRITMSDEVRQATDELRNFLFARVYIGSSAKREEAKAKRMLQDLYWFYLDKTDVFRSEVSFREGDSLERQVCDYVAGMTDRYAVAQYAKHFVPQGFKS